MDEGVAIEPLPPGLSEEDEMQAIMAEAQNAIAQSTVAVNDEVFNDPGTPLENETHEGGEEGTGDSNGLEDVAAEGADLAGEADGDGDGDAQDDEDDDDDDVEITIGAISSQPTFRPGLGRGGAVGAKPTSKLDIDAAAQIGGQSIFDVDLNSLEDKPWRKPGADITDYFNYGFTEETWQIYCDRQKKLRQEFGSAAQANKIYFSQPPIIIGGQASQPHQQAPMPVPTLEQGKAVQRAPQPTQIINLVPPSQRQENQVLRTVVPAVPTAVKPVMPVVTQAPPKPAVVLTPAVPTPAEQVPSMLENASALYDSEPSSPGTPPPRPGSVEHEDSNPPPVTRSAQPPALSTAQMTSGQGGPVPTPELGKITSTVPPTSANFSVPDLSVPPPRVLPPTNLPPPGVGMARFGPPPPMFTSIPPPGFGNPPTNLPPPGFGNPPPPGLPPHHFPPGPFGFPPPMRPQMQPPRFGPPPGVFGGFEQQPNMSRAEAHSPASYSDRSSDSDDRGDRYETRFPPGSGPPGGPPVGRPRTEHRRSRSPHSGGRHGKYSHGHSSSRHRSRSPVDRESEKDRGSSRRGRDEDDKKKSSSRSRREESSSDKKKSSTKSSCRDEGRSSSSSKKRKRSKERKDDDKSRH